ncbi:hypothetical protein NL154_16405 [Rhizobium sp. YTUHZ044]|uniref:hypothetical protein n=1 Tax=Rhizobium sp. YTUHZ044 TaxID=2962678 RepID=UPI003DAA0879
MNNRGVDSDPFKTTDNRLRCQLWYVSLNQSQESGVASPRNQSSQKARLVRAFCLVTAREFDASSAARKKEKPTQPGHKNPKS